MPKATVREGDDLYPLPEQTVFDGQLLSCTDVQVPFTYKQGTNAGKQGSFGKWEWTFVVTTPGEFDGTEVKGSSEPKVTDASDTDFLPLARPIIEGLLGRPIAVGEDIDTDDLLGLPCRFTVAHQPPRARKQGDGFWYNVEISEVFAVGGTRGSDGVVMDLDGPRGPDGATDPWGAASAEPPY